MKHVPRCGEWSFSGLAQCRDTDRRALEVAKGLDDDLCQVGDVQVMQEGRLSGPKGESAAHTLAHCNSLQHMVVPYVPNPPSNSSQQDMRHGNSNDYSSHSPHWRSTS